MSNNIPSLSEQQYADYYVKRMNNSTMPKNERKVFEEFVKTLCDHKNDNNDSSTSILSIGCGDGQLDLEWIDVITQFTSSICRYDFVEPNIPHLKKLKQKLPLFYKKGVKNINIHASKSGDINMNEIKEMNMDIIMYIHSMHWVNNPIDEIRRIKNALADNGKIIIIIQSLKGVPKLYSLLPNSHRKEIGYKCFEHLCEDLNTACIDFNAYEVESEINVTEIINLSEYGIDILSFLVAKDLRQANSKIRDNLVNAVRTMATRSNSSEWFIPEPFGVIEIKK